MFCKVVSYSNIINEMYCSEVLNKVFFKKKKKGGTEAFDKISAIVESLAEHGISTASTQMLLKMAEDL